MTPRTDDGPTRLIGAAQAGDAAAMAKLLPLVYDQLRRQAAVHLGNERTGHTLQPTALVHEAYLRIAGPNGMPICDRKHFYCAAAEAMRRILIDYARARKCKKRDGGGRRISLNNVLDL